MSYRPELDDPFYGGEKIPSLSWKNLPIGSVFTLEILEEAKALQSRDYETGELAYWDEEKKQRPKMSAVVNVRVQEGPHSVGEQRSIWAQIPSDMFTALKNAQKAADMKLLPGGILHLKLVGETPHKNPRMNAIKNYLAKYEPPAIAPHTDPFAEETSTAQGHARQQQRQPPVATGTPRTPTW